MWEAFREQYLQANDERLKFQVPFWLDGPKLDHRRSFVTVVLLS